MISGLTTKIDGIISKYGCGEKSTEKFKKFFKKTQKKLAEKNIKKNDINDLKTKMTQHYEKSCVLYSSNFNKNIKPNTQKKVNNKCSVCGAH
jgi:hypothetical protein